MELADMGDSKSLGSNTVQVQVLPGAPYYALLAQLAEATGLSPVQSEFESLEGHHIMGNAMVAEKSIRVRFPTPCGVRGGQPGSSPGFPFHF